MAQARMKGAWTMRTWMHLKLPRSRVIHVVEYSLVKSRMYFSVRKGYVSMVVSLTWPCPREGKCSKQKKQSSEVIFPSPPFNRSKIYNTGGEGGASGVLRMSSADSRQCRSGGCWLQNPVAVLISRPSSCSHSFWESHEHIITSRMGSNVNQFVHKLDIFLAHRRTTYRF